MKFPDPILDYYGFPALGLLFIVLFFLESKYGLRRRVQSRWRRIWINGRMSAVAYILLRFMFIPIMVWLAFRNQEWQIGLNYIYELPNWLEGCIAFILLDYTNYAWHILNHKIPFLWRFHHVHHTDLDLDVTTALRFHGGELVSSVFYRGAVVLLTGATPLLVIIYEVIFEAATAFHHSNTRLPFNSEKVVSKIIVTPRMHGIHHSIIHRETNSNFSVVFSAWDRVHRTLRLNIPQQDIIIGVPAYRKEEELTFLKLLILPFQKIRSWKMPDGKEPERSAIDPEDHKDRLTR